MTLGYEAKRYADLAVGALEESMRRQNREDEDRDIARAAVYAQLARAAAEAQA